uniref:Uncharacterized protein n=1 Tax=Salarias fasciatus TaxID=181472 RepID=A0A672J972_SALFA
MLNLQTNRVIDIQLVQSNEVGNSSRMEKEGFILSLKTLEERGFEVRAVVTDRHSRVQKFLRDEKPGIESGGKKMDDLGKKRGTQEVTLWRKSVVNHLHWSASTSSSGEEAVAKWSSVANHLQNVHSHENAVFPHCLHGHLQHIKNSQPFCWLHYHTSQIEVVVYSIKGMLARLQVAALHYNENATRSHASTATGELRYAVVYPKYTHGDYTVRALKTNPTSGMSFLQKTIFVQSFVVVDAFPYQDFSDLVPVPEPLCAQYEKPDKQEAVCRHRSRFAKNI